MEVRGRALYNLLALTGSKEADPWQVENYREIKEEELFKRLSALHISIDLSSLVRLSHKCDSPEDLLELILSKDAKQKEAEQIYLLIFELWRRHVGEKRSLSIFCDELDCLMERYDRGEDVVEDLFEHFEDLGQMMEESIDEESGPLEVMEYICSYLAHDVDGFLYDYIQDLMESENNEEAALLIDLFKRFSHKRRYFEFLRIQLLITEDAFDPERMIQRFADELVEAKDVDLALEFLSYLQGRGDSFAIAQFLPQILSVTSSKDHITKLKLFD